MVLLFPSLKPKTLKKIEQSYYCDLILRVTLPFLIMVSLYAAVCSKLWSNKVPGDEPNQIDAHGIEKRVTEMMIVTLA